MTGVSWGLLLLRETDPLFLGRGCKREENAIEEYFLPCVIEQRSGQEVQLEVGVGEGWKRSKERPGLQNGRPVFQYRRVSYARKDRLAGDSDLVELYVPLFGAQIHVQVLL